MKLLKSNLSKNARHLLLISVCFILATGIFSCSSEETALNPEEQPIGTDDASLLAWQMEKHFKTKAANSYSMAFVTTKTSFEFQTLDNSNGEDYIVDWGDGVTTMNVETHTYSDGLPAHTIFLYGNNNAEWLIWVSGNEIIFADISRCSNIKHFVADRNKITNIDLSKNIGLIGLNLDSNNLQSIDVSNNVKLTELFLGGNKLSGIDVTRLPSLVWFGINNNLISQIDISQNKALVSLQISNTNISTINLLNNSSLQDLKCQRCPISSLDFSNNTRLGGVACSGCSNITSLDFSNTEELWLFECDDCNIKTLTFNKNIEKLRELDTRNNPIELDSRKMTSIALSLPDRSGEIYEGIWHTSTPYTNTVKDMLDGYGWLVVP